MPSATPPSLTPNILARFLAGKASPEEAALCEQYLEESGEPVEIDVTVPDTLVAVLATETSTASVAIDSQTPQGKLQQLESETVGCDLSGVTQLLEPPLEPGDLGAIGHYRIIEFLDSGGMGLVFRATDTRLQRPVCLKLLHPSLAPVGDNVRRFMREAAAVARLHHDRIITVVDVGQLGALPWLVMPYLQGMSLRQRLQREGRLPSQLAIRVCRQVAEGLEHAHAHGLLHRDIKPENIWLTDQDEVKILDFGLARPLDDSANITQAGMLLGTPRYMSPEQIGGRPLDARSDLFSLGMVLLEMLTGRPPVVRGNLISTMLSVASEQLDVEQLTLPGDLPADVRETAQLLVQIDPERRIKSATELLERLRPWNQPDDVDRSHSVRLPAQSRWKFCPLLAGVVLGLGLAGAFGLVWDALDQGTLVVEAHDPDVEVRIAGQKVLVKDPVSGRSHEIRIGPTPLPSGVYELEVSDSNGELQFSSQMITIRRGQRALVTVTLKPSPSGRTDSMLTDSRPETSSTGSPSTSLSPPADPTFDLAARASFADLLPNLDSLPLDFLARPGGELIPFGTPHANRDLLGLENWSLVLPETGYGLSEKLSASNNCDLSLVAEISSGGMIIVRDVLGEVIHRLPVGQGFPVRVKFDNAHPNLLAVSIRTKAAENAIAEQAATIDGVTDYELQVWRLGEGEASLLHRLPLQSGSFAWDHGYRIAHIWDGWISMVRLDNGHRSKLFPIPVGSTTSLGFAGDLSPDGRYLATQHLTAGRNQVNVWDLQTGKLKQYEQADWVSSFGWIRWAEDSSRFAVFRSGDSKLVIQPLIEGLTEQAIALEEIEPGTIQTTIQALAVNRELTLAASVSKSTKLVLHYLETGLEKQLEIAGAASNSRFKLFWQPDGTLLGFNSGDSSQFKFDPSHPEKVTLITVSAQSNWRLVDAGRAPFSKQIELLWQNQLAPKSPGNVQLLEESSLGLSELSWSLLPNSGPNMLTSEWRQLNRNEFRSESPDGGQTLILRRQKPDPQKFWDLELIPQAEQEVEAIKLGRFLALGTEQFRSAWTTDQRFLAVSGLQSSETGYPEKLRVLSEGLVIFEAATGKRVVLEDFPLAFVNRTPVQKLWGWGNHFLAATRDSLFLIDPIKLSVTALQDELAGATMIALCGESLFLRPGKSKEDSAGRWDRELLRVTMVEGELRVAESFKLPVDSDEHGIQSLQLSADGRFAAYLQSPPRPVTREAARRQPLLVCDLNTLRTNPKVVPMRMDLSPETPSDWQWHPGRACLAWHRQGRLSVWDFENPSNGPITQVIYSEKPKILPTAVGWSFPLGNRLILLDYAGAHLGQLGFGGETSIKPPKFAFLLHEDGRVSNREEAVATLQLVYRKNNSIRTQALKQYLELNPGVDFPRETQPGFWGSQSKSVPK